VENGATFHPTPRELASASDIIMTSLTDQNAIDAVAFGDKGFIGGAKKGALWIDMSTIDPSASIKHAKAAKQADMQRLDTPVVGSKDLAEKGELIVLVGGDQQVFRMHEGFLKELGNTAIYLGADGNGHKMKLAVNLYLGLIAGSFSESLALSGKLGLDPKAFVETINQTPHSNYFTKGKGPKIVEGDYEPAFSLNNLFKDLRLVNEQVDRTGAKLPMTEVAIKEFSEAVQDGEGQKDFSVIALETLRKNGLS
jgi:3-hydroxyisobutyrate dehydrogenase-like beta-hydroxyacid dehydrogenase